MKSIIKKFKFDPDSKRAILGLAYQQSVLGKLRGILDDVQDTRQWFLSIDPCLSDVQLNVLEHTWGDIVILDPALEYPVFIECVSINNERSIFPEHKITKFRGENKFYCFGWPDEDRFVLSRVWNSYAKKLPYIGPEVGHYRRFSRSNIEGLRMQHNGVNKFCESILSKVHATANTTKYNINTQQPKE